MIDTPPHRLLLRAAADALKLLESGYVSAGVPWKVECPRVIELLRSAVALNTSARRPSHARDIHSRDIASHLFKLADFWDSAVLMNDSAVLLNSAMGRPDRGRDDDVAALREAAAELRETAAVLSDLKAVLVPGELLR